MADSRFVPSQWERALLRNDVSHWLGTNLESDLHKRYTTLKYTTDILYWNIQWIPWPLGCELLHYQLRLFDIWSMCHWKTWWHHQMETFPMLLVLCEGNPPVTGGFPSQRPETRSFDVFFDLCMNKLLKNNRDAGDLRRNCTHYDVIVMICRMQLQIKS